MMYYAYIYAIKFVKTSDVIKVTKLKYNFEEFKTKHDKLQLYN